MTFIDLIGATQTKCRVSVMAALLLDTSMFEKVLNNFSGPVRLVTFAVNDVFLCLGNGCSSVLDPFYTCLQMHYMYSSSINAYIIQRK